MIIGIQASCNFCIFPCKFDCSFIGFCASVGEEDTISKGVFDESAGEVCLGRGVEEVGGVGEEGSLLLNSGDPSRVSMAKGVDSDTSCEIEVFFALGIVEFGALATDEDEIRAGIGLKNVAFFVGNHLLSERVCCLQAIRGLNSQGLVFLIGLYKVKSVISLFNTQKGKGIRSRGNSRSVAYLSLVGSFWLLMGNASSQECFSSVELHFTGLFLMIFDLGMLKLTNLY